MLQSCLALVPIFVAMDCGQLRKLASILRPSASRNQTIIYWVAVCITYFKIRF